MARVPPPLPARPSSVASLSSDDDFSVASPRPRVDTIHLTPHSTRGRTAERKNHPYSGGFDDPRSSSTQSLRPVESAGAYRRTLLIVYIHGFLGNETSFKSFPAHVHNVLSTTLSETHVVYSKIYPRYKSRKNISFARDDFSRWLEPLESPKTDVILVGHSLGGILAAEVVLIPASAGKYEYRHRILGIIAVDVPFLGMHPGVVTTGISSLFRPAPEETEDLERIPTTSSSTTTPMSTTTPTSPFSDLSLDPADPNFNPAYPNDVRLANRKGKLNRAWYFWNKHWGELGKAAQSYVTSHLEFGGCLADYPGLRRRYDAVRSLEDVDEYSHTRATSGRYVRRVRFVNYYSASTGRIKEREPSPGSQSEGVKDSTQTLDSTMLNSPLTSGGEALSARTPSPRISVEEHRDGQVVLRELEPIPDDGHQDEPCNPSAAPKEPEQLSTVQQLQLLTPEVSRTTTSADEFPPLPPLPDPPEMFDPTKYADPDAQALAQKEYDREVKAYERAKKDREKTLRDWEKLIQKRIEKRAKAALKEQEKQQREQQKESLKKASTLNPEQYDRQLKEAAKAGGTAKKLKDRKFCTLPSKDPRTGRRDPTWVRVYMEGIDEVVAHTSMFKMTETYAKLVGDTVARIEDWLNEDATKRAILEASND